MGGNLNNENNRSGRPVIQPVTDGNRSGTDGRSGGSTSTTDTRTTATGSGNGTGGGNPVTVRETTDTNKISETDELALLSPEELEEYKTASQERRKILIRNAKRRKQYADKKKENGEPVKPRKVRQKKGKEPEPTIDTTQLNLIVAGISSAIASRPNCEQWLLTEKEIESITTPLSKMIAESETFASMGQYSNQIALVMACITVFVPRMIITVQKSKEVKKLAKTGQHTDTTIRTERNGNPGKTKTGNTKSDRGNESKPSTNGSNNGENVPFYGVPIC